MGLNIAQRRAVVRRQEADSGDQMIRLGRSILAGLRVLVGSETSEGEVTEVQLRLKQFNPKDTFSGLAKSAIALVDDGAQMKRRALAMDDKQPDAMTTPCTRR